MRNSDAHLPVPDAVDVAFSLLARDATVAEQLRDRLVAKMRVFLWSDAQKDIAGKDGVAVFTELYEKRAKLVVVLYRAGYGETHWTRIEETAITSRLVHTGWNGVLVVSLDGTKPSWAPASRLWLGLEQFGIDVLSDVIEARFSDLGVAAVPEGIAERATRVAAEKQAKADANLWRKSTGGVEEMNAEIERLWTTFDEKVAAINSVQSVIRVELRVTPDRVRRLRVDRAWTTLSWIQQWSNQVEGSSLYVREFAISTSTRSFVDPERQPPLAETHFLPFLDWRTGKIVWRARAGYDRNVGEGPDYSTDRLADHLLGRLMGRDGGVE